MRLIIALCALVSAQGAIASQPRAMRTEWIIQPTVPPSGELVLSAGEWVLKQRLLPIGLSEIPDGLMIPQAGINVPADRQLVEITSPDVVIFCEANIAPQKLIGHAQLCLVDYDKDGAFEGFFRTTSITKGLLNIQGNRPKSAKAIPPTRYKRVDPASMRDEFFVAIERRNFFNLLDLEPFSITFGRTGDLDRLTTGISVKSNEMPKELNFLGSSFTAIAEKDGKLRVNVLKSMPKQPFDVIEIKTYNFY